MTRIRVLKNEVESMNERMGNINREMENLRKKQKVLDMEEM